MCVSACVVCNTGSFDNRLKQWRIWLSKNFGPPRCNFLHLHAVFSEIWPNNRLATPLWGVGAPPPPPSGKSWICRWTKMFML